MVLPGFRTKQEGDPGKVVKAADGPPVTLTPAILTGI